MALSGAPAVAEASPGLAASGREHMAGDTIITPSQGWAPLSVRELWHHRELLYLLVWRNIKVRYTQTAFGAAWAVIPAVLTMLIFTLIFGRFAGLESDGAPYALFSYCALVPWVYFSSSVTLTSTSLVENERLVTRVYFPRLLVPLSVPLAGLIDLAISLVLLLALSFAYGVVPGVKLLFLGPLVLLTLVASFAVGTMLSALNVFYRDVRYVIPFLIQVWLFVTPVAYSSSIVPDGWRTIYALNPMTGVVDGFRWAVLEQAPSPALTVAVSALSSVLLLVSGLYYFRRFEATFADVI